MIPAKRRPLPLDHIEFRMFMAVGLVVWLVVGLVAFVVLRALWREFRLPRSLSSPCLCARCGHIVTDEMLARLRCPECGVPYTFGGLTTVGTRRAYREPAVVVLVAFLALSVTIGLVLLYVLQISIGHWTDDQRDVAYIVLALVWLYAFVRTIWMMARARQRLDQSIDDRASRWQAPTDHLNTQRSSIEPLTACSVQVPPTPNDP